MIFQRIGSFALLAYTLSFANYPNTLANQNQSDLKTKIEHSTIEPNPLFLIDNSGLKTKTIIWQALNILDLNASLRNALCQEAREKKKYFRAPTDQESKSHPEWTGAIRQATAAQRTDWALQYILSKFVDPIRDKNLREMILNRILRTQQKAIKAPDIIQTIVANPNKFSPLEHTLAQNIVKKSESGHVYDSVIHSTLPGINSSDAARTRIHQDIEETLYIGEVISSRQLKGKNRDPWTATLKNPRTGQIVEAFVKPRYFGDSHGWDNPTKEYAAYFVGLRILKMDYVPPTAYRYNFTLKDEITGKRVRIHEGSLSLKIPEVQTLVDVPPELWGVSERALKSDHRILRLLLGDPDGHQDNVIFGKHWMGKGVESSPVFIDFGASFISGSNMKLNGFVKHPVSMTYYSENSGIFGEPIEGVRKRTYERLKEISALKAEGKEQTLFEGLVGDQFLGVQEKALFFKHLDNILAYFDQLIQTQGEHNVIYLE